MKIRLLVIGLFFVAILFGQSDTTSKHKNTAIKESKTEKYDKIEQKLWEQNREMDKLNKNDTIK